ncbi:MAG: hypothetical protein LBF68_05245 [Christensenellaceae bacterium]|jgi:hypothetical protein|nr:hypothetical protein [Christensenellaceae bacterium]
MDYFNKDIHLKGNHEFIQQITSDKNSDISLFKAGIELLKICPIIGLVKGITSTPEKDGEKFTIFHAAIENHKQDLEHIYRLIILLHKYDYDISNEERIKNAFTNYNDKRFFEIFDSYLYGGIKWLKEQFDANISISPANRVNTIVRNFVSEYDIAKDCYKTTDL